MDTQISHTRLSNPPRARFARSVHALRYGLILTLLALSLISLGCGGKKQARYVPPAPELEGPATSESSLPTEQVPMPPGRSPHDPWPQDRSTLDRSTLDPAPGSVPGIHVDPHARAIWSEVGYASWYGPNYNLKRAANGEIYNQDEMTAAHNRLPLNSIVRVINLKNHQSTVVRITDRGPFIGDRIIDLSVAAAKAVGVYLPGTAKVQLDVLEAPRPIETGGRWCVQIGAFQAQADALDLKTQLLDRYPGSQVLQFKGPTGYWVRIRVLQDDKEKTREVYQQTRVNEGGVFMVRLD